jgi:hypothetical protein
VVVCDWIKARVNETKAWSGTTAATPQPPNPKKEAHLRDFCCEAFYLHQTLALEMITNLLHNLGETSEYWMDGRIEL